MCQYQMSSLLSYDNSHIGKEIFLGYKHDLQCSPFSTGLTLMTVHSLSAYT